MNIEIHKPELEQRVRRRVQSGQYHDMDELLTKALDALEEKDPMPTLAPSPARRRIWETIAENLKRVPPGDFAAMPKDGASQIDHYVYGIAKREI